MSLEDARAKAAALLASAPKGYIPPVSLKPPAAPGSASPAVGGAAAAPRPSVLAQWSRAGSGGQGGAVGGGGPPAASPAPPQLSAGMKAAAEMVCDTLARLNGAAVALTVRAYGKRQPPPVTDAQREQLSAAWRAGVLEWMASNNLSWWHLVLLANGTVALELYQQSTPLELEATPPSGGAETPTSRVS